MWRPLLLGLALAAAAPAHAQERANSYGVQDEGDARVTVQRSASRTAVDYTFNVLPKSGLRVSGSTGIKVTVIHADGWQFTRPMPKVVYAGSDYFDGAPAIAITATRVNPQQPATLIIQYALCRDTACILRSNTVAID
jgi:hypothetical protein